MARRWRRLWPLLAVLVFYGCVESRYMSLPNTIPKDFASDDYLSQVYEARRWVPRDELTFNPIGLISSIDIPVNSAQAKIIGPQYESSLQSLATKLWLIDNARYTIDIVYYIFKPDRVGNAVLGALCNAVKRGVDVRLMIDSIGSFDYRGHQAFRALEACAAEAGFIRMPDGSVTDRRARVQFVVINALSNVFVRANRRSHDKLLVIDGLVPERTVVITGGRNISADYYGIDQDGAEDPYAYQDLEVVLRTSKEAGSEPYPLGKIATYYFTSLFLHVGNKRVRPAGPKLDNPHKDPPPDDYSRYRKRQQKQQDDLEFLKAVPLLAERFAAMEQWFATDFVPAKVRLAHDLSNLTNESPIKGAEDNIERNRNSISHIAELIARGQPPKRRIRIVSPYFFFLRYVDKDGNVVRDGTQEILQWLEENPEGRFELITNSVLTSDNFFTQAIIDIEELPRLLLTPEITERWAKSIAKGEENPELVDSERWRQLVSHPRIDVYQTGRGDARILGGDAVYGKLHAKFAVMDDFGFIGTSNFDHRSRLFNNEVGFYFDSDPLRAQLNVVYDELKARSLKWGSPEWLAMRRELRDAKGIKALTTRWQRTIYRVLNAFGVGGPI